ncbi:unnamed protein product [Caenorhabditis brenneri]
MVSRLECSICFYNFDDFEHLPKLLEKCKHTFCYQCLDDWLNKKSQDTCPTCRESINMTEEIPTNVELLAVFEKRKEIPECNCSESRTHYCPTCYSQNYVDWEDRRDSGEHTFCLGCACDHFYEMEHKSQQLDTDENDMMMKYISEGVDLEKAASVVKETGNPHKKVIIVAGGITIALISLALAVLMCINFKVIQF